MRLSVYYARRLISFLLLTVSGLFARVAARRRCKGPVDPGDLLRACDDVRPEWRTNLYERLLRTQELVRLKAFDFSSPILELGGGAGEMSALMMQGRDQHVTVFSDYWVDNVSRANARATRTHDRGAAIDAQELPFASGQFGTVVALNMLYRLPDRDACLSEIWRVIRPGGRLIFTDISPTFASSYWNVRLLMSLGLTRWADRHERRVYLHRGPFPVRTTLEHVDLDRWRLCASESFLSGRAMSFWTLFESLTGSRGMLFEGLRGSDGMAPVYSVIARSIDWLCRYLVLNDAALSKVSGGCYTFVVLEKKGGALAELSSPAAPFVCPHCKGDLCEQSDALICRSCGFRYPVQESIPVFTRGAFPVVTWDTRDPGGQVDRKSGDDVEKPGSPR